MTSALLVSVFLPRLIVVLLVISGSPMFKGVEKLAYKFLHCKHDLEQEHAQQFAAVA